jgi:hypothetical protein
MSNTPEQFNETNEPTTTLLAPFSLASRDKPFIGLNRPAAPDLVGPEAPTQNQASSHDIRVQGSQQEKDRKEYFADLEERRKRAAEFEARRQQASCADADCYNKLRYTRRSRGEPALWS